MFCVNWLLHILTFKWSLKPVSYIKNVPLCYASDALSQGVVTVLYLLH